MGEFSKVVQILDDVSCLCNCLKFSQPFIGFFCFLIEYKMLDFSRPKIDSIRWLDLFTNRTFRKHRHLIFPHWPDLYWRRIIRLGRAWAKNDSSSDNPSVYKYGQADGSSIQTSYRDNPSCQTNHRG